MTLQYFTLGYFVPTALVMLDVWNIASITFSLDEPVKDLFPSVKSVNVELNL